MAGLLPFDYAVRSLWRSPRRTAAALAGNTLVVLLVIAAASFVEGMRASLSPRADSGNVILLATGSEESIERSEIDASVPGVVAASLPGLRSHAGVTHLSPEILSALVVLPSRDSARELRAVVRGVTPGAFLVHAQVEIVEGRAPRPGRNEMMAGTLAAEKLGLEPGALAPGRSLWFEGQDWTVVGRFSAPGTVMEGELWIPLSDLRVATKRDGLSCVVLGLDRAEFADVDAFTKMRIDLELSAVREADYYSGLHRFYRPIRVMILVTAGLMAVAGILGGLNTLYSAFSVRIREVGMLQALGYSRRAIVACLVQEAVIVAALAVLLASVSGRLLLDGIAISFSMGVFQLAVGGPVLTAGCAAGLLLGLLGALPPALRCLRLPIPEALKAV
jgi:putative ABC transport system permease protein